MILSDHFETAPFLYLTIDILRKQMGLAHERDNSLSVPGTFAVHR